MKRLMLMIVVVMLIFWIVVRHRAVHSRASRLVVDGNTNRHAQPIFKPNRFVTKHGHTAPHALVEASEALEETREEIRQAFNEAQEEVQHAFDEAQIEVRRAVDD